VAGGGLGFGTDNIPLALGVVSFCVFMVGAFASSEAAILSANRLRIQQLAEKGDKAAQAFCELRNHEDRLFATILAVENMFIILAASFGVASVENILGDGHQLHLGWLTVATLSLVPLGLEFLIVLFGEITPKTYAARHAMRVALLVSRPLYWVVRSLYPVIKYTFVLPSRGLIYILDRFFEPKGQDISVTEEELRLMIDRSSQEGVIEHQERDLIQSVFDFRSTVTAEIMTDRTHMVTLPVEMDVQSGLQAMMTHRYSKYPLHGHSIDDILGVVHAKDLFRAQVSGTLDPAQTLRDYLRPTLFVPENKGVVQLLEVMQQRDLRLVIVADEFGGTEGMLTLQDLIRELVGHHVHKEQQTGADAIQSVSENRFRIRGMTPLYDVNQQLQVSLPEGHYQTIAGFVLAHLGHIPATGEQLSYGSVAITVTEAVGPRIVELELQWQPEADSSSTDG
jgi:putative hemolysin